MKHVHSVLGPVDLDPASEPLANERIKANRVITESEDGLLAPWSRGSVFLNPPGGKVGRHSKTSLFWQRLMRHLDEGHLSHAIFMCFSAEALQTTQGKGCRPVGDFVVCIPKKRIAFDYPAGNSGGSPSHGNAIIYVPGYIDNTGLFVKEFRQVGSVMRGMK